jgi:hypothetical protein
MNTNRTPGPWIAKRLVHTGRFAILRETPDGHRRVDDKRGEYNEADANLIATAPDLLAELKNCADFLEVQLPKSAQLIGARKTIAKATGAEARAAITSVEGGVL